jgi:hypothetical protein
MRSADAQIAAMRRDWPAFRLCRCSGGRLMWRGTLTPFAVSYDLQLELVLPRQVGYRTRTGGSPRITVRSPRLRARRADPTKPIPHIYKNETEPDFPLLCLYDPAKREWTHDLFVAGTIVPWSIDWLACYELWHVDGNWVGGGRHPDPTPKPIQEAA